MSKTKGYIKKYTKAAKDKVPFFCATCGKKYRISEFKAKHYKPNTCFVCFNKKKESDRRELVDAINNLNKRKAR